MTAALLLAAGFLVGVLVGREIDDLYYLVRLRTRHHGRPQMSTERKQVRRQTVLMWMLVAVLVFNALVGVLLQVTRNSQAAFTACSAEYDQQFSAAYKARLSASNQASDALDRLVMAVDSKDREEFQRSLDNYVTLRTKAKATAQANPYPPLPEQYCGVPK